MFVPTNSFFLFILDSWFLIKSAIVGKNPHWRHLVAVLRRNVYECMDIGMDGLCIESKLIQFAFVSIPSFTCFNHFLIFD